METALTKEVERTNRQIALLQGKATALAVTHPDHLSEAADLLGLIKSAEGAITDRKTEITRPMMAALASVRDLFRPMEDGLDTAKKLIKAKVVAYQTIQEEKQRVERERIAARVAKGTMKEETAVRKEMEREELPKTVGKMQTRTITKVRVVDEWLVPRMYLVPDMAKITEAVLKKGIAIDGVEKYTEKIVAM